MTGRTPWWKTMAKPVILATIYERLQHDPGYEGAEALEDSDRFADEILGALEEAGYRIVRTHIETPGERREKIRHRYLSWRPW